MKQIIAILAAVLFSITLVGCGGSSQSSSSVASASASTAAASSASTSGASEQATSSNSAAPATSTSNESASSTTLAVSAEGFVAAVREAIAGDVSASKGEAIIDVSLDNGKLVVKVDMGSSYDGQQGAGKLTMAQVVALNRFSDITDDILDLDEYDSLWDTVVVDFGKDGSVTKAKIEAKNSTLGRYFDVQDSDLEF